MGFKEWHVLVVERKVESVFCISHTLKYFDIPSRAVLTLEEALYCLKTDVFTHIICDLSVDLTDPWTVIKKLQAYKDQIDVPCIAVTDLYLSGLGEAAIEAGFSGYFVKPIDDVVLFCALQNTMVG